MFHPVLYVDHDVYVLWTFYGLVGPKHKQLVISTLQYLPQFLRDVMFIKNLAIKFFNRFIKIFSD